MRVFVLGPPGCGKSSIISALFGLTEHDNRASCEMELPFIHGNGDHTEVSVY